MGGRLGRATTLRVLGLAASLVAVVIVLASVDLSQTLQLLADADIRPIAACLLLVATQMVIRTARWRLLLAPPAGQGQIPLGRIGPVLLVGYLGNAVLPARLGEPIRALLLSRREGLTVANTLGSVALERVVDAATLAVVVWIGASITEAPAWVINAGATVAAAASGALVALATIGLTPIARAFGLVLERLPGRTRTRPLSLKALEFAKGIDSRSRSRGT